MSQIASRAQTEITKEQREYMLRHQMRAIQDELGDANPEKAEVELLRLERPRWGIASGLCAGMAILTRPALIPAVMVLGLVTSDLSAIRPTIRFVATLCAFLVSQLVVNRARDWLEGLPPTDPSVVGSAEHRALALEVARRSITVVRDRGGLLRV